MRPDAGHVTADLPVHGLLDLNAGMHPDLTGRENLYISGSILGLLSSEIAERYDAIVEFAQLQDAIDQPMRTYSNGMKLRLGFSVAVHVDPRILLVDEVLAVGDLGFQTRCLEKIRQLRDGGTAIVLISHDLPQIEAMSDRAIWLSGGTVAFEGRPADAIGAYRDTLTSASEALTPINADPDDQPRGLTLGENRIGSQDAVISDVVLSDTAGNPITNMRPGEPLQLTAHVKSRTADLDLAHFSMSISDSEGTRVFDLNTDVDAHVLQLDRQGKLVTVELERVDLVPGQYRVSVGLFDTGWSHALDYHRDAYSLRIDGGPNMQGVLSPPRRWRLD